MQKPPQTPVPSDSTKAPKKKGRKGHRLYRKKHRVQARHVYDVKQALRGEESPFVRGKNPLGWVRRRANPPDIKDGNSINASNSRFKVKNSPLRRTGVNCRGESPGGKMITDVSPSAKKGQSTHRGQSRGEPESKICRPSNLTKAGK